MSGTVISDVQVSNGELGLSQCVWCRHRWANGQRCAAFPNGIPEAIIRNRHDHREPYDGDSGICFEPEEVEIEFVDQDDDDAPPRRARLEAVGECSCDDGDGGPELVELDEIELEVDWGELDVLRL